MILVNGELVDQSTRFPDGTLSLRITANRINSPYIIRWHYHDDSEMATLYYLVNHLRAYGCHIVLELPYIPNSRMDRVKNSDEVFTLKYFANFINSFSFERVVCVDPHSSVSCALIHNIVCTDPMEFIAKTINAINDPELALFYPDEGAMKRYSGMIEKPYGFGIKRRNWRTGAIEKLDVVGEDVVKDKNVLIVDDICSAGGTFYFSGKALKDAGAKDIYLHVSHCEDTVLRGRLMDADFIKRIYITNSIDSILSNMKSNKIRIWEI